MSISGRVDNYLWTTVDCFLNLINEKKINYVKNAKVTKVSEDKIGNVSVTMPKITDQ